MMINSKQVVALLLFFLAFSLVGLPEVLAAEENLNINSSAFSLVVCDGPKIPDSAKKGLIPDNPAEFEAKFGHPPPYVPCDFNAAMTQIQHLINIAIILGVLVAICLFTYAGYLYIKGGKGIDEAKKIFPKVFWGFIIMLSAWFIVYQLLNWLTGSNAFSVLLGNPK